MPIYQATEWRKTVNGKTTSHGLLWGPAVSCGLGVTPGVPDRRCQVWAGEVCLRPVFFFHRESLHLINI